MEASIPSTPSSVEIRGFLLLKYKHPEPLDHFLLELAGRPYVDSDYRLETNRSAVSAPKIFQMSGSWGSSEPATFRRVSAGMTGSDHRNGNRA